jgi:hypothetical protein
LWPVVSGSTSKHNKAVQHTLPTCRNAGKMAIQRRRNASCGSRDNEAHAFRDVFHIEVRLDVFRKAWNSEALMIY